jgi:hypothetical protein
MTAVAVTHLRRHAELMLSRWTMPIWNAKTTLCISWMAPSRNAIQLWPSCKSTRTSDFLHSDPRYQTLEKKMGFPPGN